MCSCYNSRTAVLPQVCRVSLEESGWALDQPQAALYGKAFLTVPLGVRGEEKAVGATTFFPFSPRVWHSLRADPGSRRGKQQWILPLPERVLSEQGTSAVTGTASGKYFRQCSGLGSIHLTRCFNFSVPLLLGKKSRIINIFFKDFWQTK